MYVSKNMTYKELVSIVHTVVKYDVNKYSVDLQSISIVPVTTCRTLVRNDDDVQFMLEEDRLIPQVCVSLIERAARDVIGNDIPPGEITQQFGSASGSNQVFTKKSATEGRENMCTVTPEVDNEANIDPVDHVENIDEELVQIQRHGRGVEGVSCTALDIPGTSEVRHHVSADDSDNATTWVIPGVDSYSFGIGRSSTLVAEESISMTYKVCLIDNCTWKLRAVRRDEGTYFQVRSFVNEHSCLLEEIHHRHRQASAVIIGGVVAPRLRQQDGRLMCPKDLIADMKTMASLRGFRRCISHVITVDGTHLKGRFGGTMFVATAQDGNEQVYPIGFGYGDSENNLSWEWFLDCLKGALGHIDDLVFISDQHASIEVRISKVFSYATHTICCWHFAENFKKRFHRKDVAAIMDKAT
ncbi:hypothetical protein Dsin_018641 [Dipteronia sinensis]|uniref:MULE transposase domain-containing protein n=1 Tax=Dipteronia sinensis TaxID=43782 RepID=A0AAE0E203_9ROSI|nr:hypothetical protein Dsin_018641 [Dipteronia sinensis]